MKADTIIWDWNGTLLNDISLCISSINSLLENRGLANLNKTDYQEVFSFPVKDYYSSIGFDLNREDFSVPAHEFIALYEAGVESCTLHAGALQVLSFFHEKGHRQFVLSAMQQDLLEKTLKAKNIYHFFEGVAGLDDHYAVSKEERGKQLIKCFGIRKKSALIIGDTIHDYEVAKALGVECILISDGHQSEKRLKSTGAVVINNLMEMMRDVLIKEP